MRRLSRRLFARTRLNAMTRLLVGACLATGWTAVQAGSLLEPGTTTYELMLDSAEPVTVGPDHRLILNTENAGFHLLAPVVNHGTVQIKTSRSAFEVPVFAIFKQVNRGQWFLDDQVLMHFSFDDVDNHRGTFQIGKNSALYAHGAFSGGSIHGINETSQLWANRLQDVTLSGQVRLLASGMSAYAGPLKDAPPEVSGTLTVNGLLHAESMRLGSNTVLQGGGRTILSGGSVTAFPEAPGSQMTIASGHTMTGHGQLSNFTLINEGALRVESTRTISSNAVVVQQGADAITQVTGGLTAEEFLLRGGVIDVSGVLASQVTVDGGTLVMHEGGALKGDVDVRSGRVSVYASSPRALGEWGSLALDGDLILSNAAEFEVILTASMGHIEIPTTGRIQLGGKLILTFAEGARPLYPDFVLFFDGYDGVSVFKSLEVRGAGNLPWHIAEQSGPFVVLSSVPEPETWGLMLCGLGVVGWRLRRRTVLRPLH